MVSSGHTAGKQELGTRSQGESKTPAETRPASASTLMPLLWVSLPSLNIQSCKLLGSALKLLPNQGLLFSVSDSFIQVTGSWKVRKRIL